MSPPRYISPNGGATKDILCAKDKAEKEVLVQAFSFTSQSIAKALLETHKRGIHL